DALLDRPLRNRLADRRRALHIAALDRFVKRSLQRGIDRRRRDECLAAHVVDHLRVDVAHAAEHAEARALFRPRDPLALAQVNPNAAIVFRLDLHSQPSALSPPAMTDYFAPVFPAFFFSTSPV